MYCTSKGNKGIDQWYGKNCKRTKAMLQTNRNLDKDLQKIGTITLFFGIYNVQLTRLQASKTITILFTFSYSFHLV